MTLLIADSGSTKTEWIFTDSLNRRKLYTTRGLNPYFSSAQQLQKEIGNLAAEIGGTAVDKIFFYGAGCSAPAMAGMVRDAVLSVFPSAAVTVDTDLLAAAKACFNGRSGIACILGTGSNSCIYDGKRIIDRIPSLGFTFGDEGSGGYFGKKLLRDYYYQIMPEELRTSLEEKFDMALDNTLEHIYRQPRPNTYVASFAYLLADFAGHSYIRDVVEKGFNEFVIKQLHYFKRHGLKNVGFVGSVAALNRDILEKVLNEHGYELDVIVRKPIERLAEYHLAEEAKKLTP